MAEKTVKITDVDIPEVLMRDEEDNEGVAELAEDIRDNGLINAITVRPNNGRYELVAGRRRLKAHVYLGREEIRAVVEELNDEQALAVMASENLFRQAVDPVDEAKFVAKLMNTGKYTEEELGRLFHRSAGWITDRLEILTYPDYLVALVKTGQLPLGVARELNTISDEVYRKMYVDQASHYGTTVLQAQHIRRQFEAGLLSPSEAIMPPSNEELKEAPPSFTTPCVRCTLPATQPNIKNVFIHRECPPKDEEVVVEPPGPPGQNPNEPADLPLGEAAKEPPIPPAGG